MLALLVLVLIPFTDAESEAQLLLSGCIGLAALLTDFWPRFVSTWNTLLGRILILLLYAILANMAIAASAQTLNNIVGIEPWLLFYSLGFTALFLAPFWLLIVTMIAIFLFMTVQQFILMFNLLLKLIRLKRFKINSGQKHPTTTAVVKLIVMPGMFWAIVNAIGSYGEVINTDSSHQTGVNCAENKERPECQDNFSEKFSEAFGLSSKEKQEVAEALEAATAETKKSVDEQLETKTSEETKEKTKKKDQFSFPYVIASFVYNMELFSSTQCVQAPGEKALFIGENDIFIGKPNKTSPIGYDFYVRTCVLKSY